MRSWLVRFALLALCTFISLPLGASVADFTWDAQAQPRWAGTAVDPNARDVQMSSLQKSLVARQVASALDRQVVVNLSSSDRKRIDQPGPADGRYLVGVNRPVGVTVTFPAAMSKRARDLAVGAVRGTADGGMVWTAALRAPGATALRAHLTGLDLPAGAALFVYNATGMAFGPYTGRGPNGNGDFFTNTVFGEQLLLQLVVAEGTPRVPAIRIEELGVLGQRFVAPKYGPHGVFDANDLDRLANAKQFCSYNASCIVNASCGSTSGAVSCAREAVASILFSSGGSQYICTGGLIQNSASKPYFLTAHHCINKSGEASSLETYFDYTTTCSSPNCSQPYNNTGDTVGSTILATGSSSDYSLLQLSATPTTKNGTTCYLGWSTSDISNSTTQLYRISHPQGAPQAYSEQRVDPSSFTCRTLPRGSFLYSQDNLGATEGGSSGSPVLNGSGQIVGQLYGACGSNLNDVCDESNNRTVDGAFAASYPNLASFLSGGGGGGGCSAAGASCTSDSQCCSSSCKGKRGAKTCH